RPLGVAIPVEDCREKIIAHAMFAAFLLLHRHDDGLRRVSLEEGIDRFEDVVKLHALAEAFVSEEERVRAFPTCSSSGLEANVEEANPGLQLLLDPPTLAPDSVESILRAGVVRPRNVQLGQELAIVEIQHPPLAELFGVVAKPSRAVVPTQVLVPNPHQPL